MRSGLADVPEAIKDGFPLSREWLRPEVIANPNGTWLQHPSSIQKPRVFAIFWCQIVRMGLKSTPCFEAKTFPISNLLALRA
jgi:hypothetical protein